MESALASMDASAAGGEAGGHAVDYDSLPNAIVPVMADLFKAPLSKEEEYYALEVCTGMFACAFASSFLLFGISCAFSVLRSAFALCSRCVITAGDGIVHDPVQILAEEKFAVFSHAIFVSSC